MPSLRIVLPVYLLLLFLTRYYDFFYLYLPVRAAQMQSYDPTLGSFLLYNYLLKVIYYSSKFIVVAVILMAGVFLEGKKNKDEMVSFKDLITLVITAEFIFIAQDLVKIVYFAFINPDYTKEMYDAFYPLSLFSLLNIDSASPYAYLFQVINIFEIAYITCLIYGLQKLQYQKEMKAVPVVLSSYGSMLIVWVLILTYFQL